MVSGVIPSFLLALPGEGGITVKRPRLKRSVNIDIGIDILFMLSSPEAPSGVFGIRGGVDARSAGLLEEEGIEHRS